MGVQKLILQCVTLTSNFEVTNSLKVQIADISKWEVDER